MKWGVRALGQYESCGEEGSGMIDCRDQINCAGSITGSCRTWAEIWAMMLVRKLKKAYAYKERNIKGKKSKTSGGL